MKTVNDMYKYAVANNIKLLSTFNAPFWAEYLNNSANYDRLFRRKYLSFRYFLHASNEDISEITTDFIEDVYDHLLANSKKYSELYRVNVVDDEEYSLLNNYNIKEVMDKDGTSNDDNTYGSRNDSSNETVGSQTNSVTDKTAPYDSENFYNANSSSTSLGARTDSNSFTKGQQVDSLDTTYTEDYTLTRVGNIGVQTGADMLEKHKKFWTKWQFYEYIFEEISKELLLV